jgi:hypothetical protein
MVAYEVALVAFWLLDPSTDPAKSQRPSVGSFIQASVVGAIAALALGRFVEPWLDGAHRRILGLFRSQYKELAAICRERQIMERDIALLRRLDEVIKPTSEHAEWATSFLAKEVAERTVAVYWLGAVTGAVIMWVRMSSWQLGLMFAGGALILWLLLGFLALNAVKDFVRMTEEALDAAFPPRGFRDGIS